MTKISTPSHTDLEDYAAIKKHLPLATPKQVKWIKEMFDMARSLGEQEPIAERYLEVCNFPFANQLNRELFLSGAIPLEIKGEYKHGAKLQILASIKSSIALRLKSRRDRYAPKAQMDLFHPEAFENQ